MPSSTLLLIELLDGVGSHEADAALRARALRRVGMGVQPLVLDLIGPRAAASADGSPASNAALRRDAGHAARREADSVCPSAVWIAGARSSAGGIAAALEGYEIHWWPTRLEPVEPRAADPDDRRLHIVGASNVSAERRRFHALDFAVVRAARVREPAALWDGDFMLAPGPIEPGGETLELFARVAAERPELDLVVLDDPTPETEQATRALGLFPRVHFAGHATREAEHTWLATASAVLVASESPTSAALVLRALAAGAPVVPVGRSIGARLLREWLKLRLGIAAATASDALNAALTHDVSQRNSITAGRTLAAEHAPETLSERLFGTHPHDGEAREVA